MRTRSQREEVTFMCGGIVTPLTLWSSKSANIFMFHVSFNVCVMRTESCQNANLSPVLTVVQNVKQSSLVWPNN